MAGSVCFPSGLLLSLKLSEELPVFGGIDLNQEPHLEPVDAL
jgi:hypothetical protein